MKRLILLLAMVVGMGCIARAQVPGLGKTAGPPAFPKPPREWAVLVGVSNYLHMPQSQWLDGCDGDAKALAEFLSSPRGGSFPADHVKLMVNQQATTVNIRLAMDYLIKHVAPGDVVYIFFACHGKVEIYGSGEVGYLLPYDCDPDHLNATALPMDEIHRYVDVNLRQAQVVLITDACHAGGLGPNDGDQRRSLVSVNDHLMAIGERSGALNIMACRRDESAIEDPRLGGHGVLTYCLLRALSGDCAPADGTVRAQDVLEYLMRQVPRLSNQDQHPRHSSNYNDEFPMATLALAGPVLDLPAIPSDVLASVSPRDIIGGGAQSAASLRVTGAPENSELYLLHGSEQRSIGRVFMGASTLVLDGIPPGKYVIVESLEGKQQQWPIELSAGLHSFDVRAGEVQ